MGNPGSQQLEQAGFWASCLGWSGEQADETSAGGEAGVLTSHRLLQELGDLVRVLGVQGGGEDKLALRFHEVLPEQLPASGKGLTYQGLRGQDKRERERKRLSPETESIIVTSHNVAMESLDRKEPCRGKDAENFKSRAGQQPGGWRPFRFW